MLEHLHITNYALIDETEITFHPGLNIITGETGAGKSIIMGALSMLLGGRVDSKKVKQEGKKTVVEAEFRVGNFPWVEDFCKEHNIDDCEEGICIVRREVNLSGKTRAFINDSPVNLSVLSEITEKLTDIHSQNENQLLSQAEFQLEVVDTLSENREFLDDYSKKFNDFKDAFRRLKKTKARLERLRKDEDFLRYQYDQFERVNPTDGELEELEQLQENLKNASDQKQSLFDALERLSDGRINSLSLLEEAKDCLGDVADTMDDGEELIDRLENLRIELKDISSTLSNYYGDLSGDPDELSRIEERVSELKSLMKKHSAANFDELLSKRDILSNQLELIENGDDIVSEIEKEAKQLYGAAKAAALRLSERRKEAAKRFESLLIEKAMPLGMRNLRFEVKIEPTELGPTGSDKVTFLFAFNKNQSLTTVGGNASGGEVSRLMLCIKSIVGNKMNLPTIVFDEIDTGVSGEIGSKIGRLMNDISSSIQVIAITHLPQVAARGDHHFKVFKTDDETSTRTQIKELNQDERIEELAQMLGDGSDTDAARANAKSLLTTES